MHQWTKWQTRCHTAYILVGWKWKERENEVCQMVVKSWRTIPQDKGDSSRWKRSEKAFLIGNELYRDVKNRDHTVKVWGGGWGVGKGEEQCRQKKL